MKHAIIKMLILWVMSDSLYVVLPPGWAAMMQDSLKGNSRFITRQTLPGSYPTSAGDTLTGAIWVTSASMVSDPNFQLDFHQLTATGWTLDTLQLDPSDFKRPNIDSL